MNWRKPGWLRQRPLIALLVLEALIVVAFLAVAWNVWQSHHVESHTQPVGGPRSAIGEARQAYPPLPGSLPTPPTAGSPAPGVRTDPPFVARQLSAINRDQSALEQVEWRLLEAVVRAARGYLENVVLPAIRRSQHSGRSP